MGGGDWEGDRVGKREREWEREEGKWGPRGR